MLDPCPARPAAARGPNPFIAAAIMASLMLAACAGEPEPKPRPKVSAEQGFKYYVGGPVMKTDEYGRNRLSGFNGPVMQPTSRGLLVGVRIDADANFKFRTWLNGALAQSSSGFIKDDGTYWYLKREGYDAAGMVVTKRTYQYDDDAQQTTTVLTYYDTDDGSVLEERTVETPYEPPPWPISAKQQQKRAERREKRTEKRADTKAKEATR